MDRNELLAFIKRYCHKTIGFEMAFETVSLFTLLFLKEAIIEHGAMRVVGCHEFIDFLDGNNFLITAKDDNVYTITCLYDK